MLKGKLVCGALTIKLQQLPLSTQRSCHLQAFQMFPADGCHITCQYTWLLPEEGCRMCSARAVAARRQSWQQEGCAPCAGARLSAQSWQSFEGSSQGLVRAVIAQC